MYPRPQRIWVRALVRQFGPALDILLPGSACGMPYALDDGFAAVTLQPLSLFHSCSRQPNWLEPQPRADTMPRAMDLGLPPEIEDRSLDRAVRFERSRRDA